MIVMKGVCCLVVVSAPFALRATASLVLLFVHDCRHLVILIKIIKTLTFSIVVVTTPTETATEMATETAVVSAAATA